MKQNNIKEVIFRIEEKTDKELLCIPADKSYIEYEGSRYVPISELITLIDKVREEGKIEVVKGIRSGIQSASYKHPQSSDVLNAVVLTLNTILEELEKRAQSLKGDKE